MPPASNSRLSDQIYEFPAFSLTPPGNGRTSDVDIPSSRAYPVEHPGSPGPLLLLHSIELRRYKLFTSKPGTRRGVIDQVFKESRKRVWIAAQLDGAGLCNRHKIPAGSPQPVARRAKGRDVPQICKIADHLVQGAVVAQLKLCHMVLHPIRISARIGPAACGNLRDPQFQGCPTKLSIL